MTELAPAFERTPRLAELSTNVLRTGEQDGHTFAVLRDTILYPEGGGQPSDRGSVNGVEVLDVQKVDGEIRHYLAEQITAGPAHLVLDWKRRFDHMQQHTAQHLLSAVALELFDWPTTSFHLGESQCDIELDVAEVESDALEALQARVRQEIRAARPVTARRITVDEYKALGIRTRGLPEGHRGDVRLVEIEGIDVTTCGGTHLSSTAEIESVHLGPTESLRGGTRLFWLAGGRVHTRLALLEQRNRELRRLLETSGVELVGATRAKLETLREARRELKRKSAELAEARAGALAASPERVVEDHYAFADGGFLQAVARGLLSRAPEKLALLTAAGESGSFFSIVAGADSGAHLSELGPRVAEVLSGRGGGSATVFQGKAESLDRRLEALELVRAAPAAGGRAPTA
jgi:Ser-tRNA(Ala) deacylase AlaX